LLEFSLSILIIENHIYLTISNFPFESNSLPQALATTLASYHMRVSGSDTLLFDPDIVYIEFW